MGDETVWHWLHTPFPAASHLLGVESKQFLNFKSKSYLKETKLTQEVFENINYAMCQQMHDDILSIDIN